MRQPLARRIVSGFSAAALAVATSLTAFSGLTAAAGTTCTWTGTAGDNKFSTVSNWSGCNSGAPQTGDIISFGYISNTPVTLINDLSGSIALGGVSMNTKGPNVGDSTAYTVDKLNLGDGATLQSTYGFMSVTDVTQSGSLVVSGYLPLRATSHDINLTPTNFTTNVPSFCMGAAPEYSVNIKPTGTVTVQDKGSYGIQGTEAAIVVNSGGMVVLNGDYAGNITFNGGGATQGSLCGQPKSLIVNTDSTLSGTITLNAGDIEYDIAANKTLTITGTIQGPGSMLKAISTSAGTFANKAATNNSATPSGSQTVPMQVLPAITDSLPSQDLRVESNQTIALDGARRNVSVDRKSVLNGTGTAESLFVYGTVAPGHSPGKLTVLKVLSIADGATYQAELQTATDGGYDQIVVGSASDTSGNSVTLGYDPNYPTLDVQLYKGYKIKGGDQFTIINNQSKTPVKGIFNGLPEGATFKGPDGSVFKISYTGGDGNDVVLTVVTAPTAPDTGFAVSFANPMVTLAAAVVAAGAILVASRRLNGARK